MATHLSRNEWFISLTHWPEPHATVDRRYLTTSRIYPPFCYISTHSRPLFRNYYIPHHCNAVVPLKCRLKPVPTENSHSLRYHLLSPLLSNSFRLFQILTDSCILKYFSFFFFFLKILSPSSRLQCNADWRFLSDSLGFLKILLQLLSWLLGIFKNRRDKKKGTCSFDSARLIQ